MHDQWTGPELDSLLGKTRADAARDAGDLARRRALRWPCSPVARRHRHHDRHRGPHGGRGEDPGGRRRDSRLSRHAGQGQARSRSCSSCRRSSACTSTSRTSAAASRRRATCAVAPELYARQGDVSKITRLEADLRRGRVEGAGRAGDVRPRRDGRLGRRSRRRATRRASASPASAGAAASPGSTPRTTRS